MPAADGAVEAGRMVELEANALATTIKHSRRSPNTSPTCRKRTVQGELEIRHEEVGPTRRRVGQQQMKSTRENPEVLLQSDGAETQKRS